MMEEAKLNKICIIDHIALYLIGLLSLGYFIFERDFAKLIISFQHLPFPIFIGEAVLFLCMVFFILKWLIAKPRFNIWHGIIIIYFALILVKALYGYSKWGALAFRHAAMFYYPIFALFGYFFYNRVFFGLKKAIFLISLFFIILLSNFFYDFYTLNCFVLVIILINQLSSKITKYLILPPFLILGYWRLFLQSSRALLVSNIISLIFIIISFIIILNSRRMHKAIILTFLLFLTFFGVSKLSDKNALSSLIYFKQTLDLYNSYEDYILKNIGNFKIRETKQIKIYNNEPMPAQVSENGKENFVFVDGENKGSYIINTKEYTLKDKNVEKNINVQSKTLVKISTPTTITRPKDKEWVLYQKQKKPKEGYYLRNFEAAKGNSVFRIFVWKDILGDLNREKPLLGFDFGKPFRSKNIEILRIAEGEWSRDGWIAAHNSYLEIIYRLGALGIILILILFMLLSMMIKQAVKLKSIKGLLLCTALINWLIAANFMLVFELPYNTIPLWTLSGMAFAYLFNNKKQQHKLNVNE